MNRRRLLAAMGSGLTLLPAAGFGDASPARAPIQRVVPATGERLRAVGLGTWQTFSLARREAAAAVLARFVALGGQLVDTSPMYGDAERTLGVLGSELDALDRLFLATKVWTRGQAAGHRQIEASQRLMQRRPLDLIQVHNLVDWRIHLPHLLELKRQGRLRYVGITHYVDSAHESLRQILLEHPIDFVQVNYNVAARAAADRLLPTAADRGVAVIVNRPYQEGALFGRVRGQSLPPWSAEFGCTTWGQFFLKFILGHPAVTCAIPATSKVHHLEDNLAAATGRVPNATERNRMVSWFDSL